MRSLLIIALLSVSSLSMAISTKADRQVNVYLSVLDNYPGLILKQLDNMGYYACKNITSMKIAFEELANDLKLQQATNNVAGYFITRCFDQKTLENLAKSCNDRGLISTQKDNAKKILEETIHCLSME